MVHESDVDTNCNYCGQYNHQIIVTEIRGLGNKRINEDHPIISEIGQNAEKGSGHIRRH